MNTYIKKAFLLTTMICSLCLLVSCKTADVDGYIEKLESSEWSFVVYDEDNMDEHPHYDIMTTDNIKRMIEAVKMDQFNNPIYGTIVEYKTESDARASYQSLMEAHTGYFIERIGKALIYSHDADFFHVIGVKL